MGCSSGKKQREGVDVPKASHEVSQADFSKEGLAHLRGSRISGMVHANILEKTANNDARASLISADVNLRASLVSVVSEEGITNTPLEVEPGERRSVQFEALRPSVAPEQPTSWQANQDEHAPYGSRQRGSRLEEATVIDPEWLSRLVCMRIEISKEGYDDKVNRVRVPIKDMLTPLNQCQVKAYQEFRHNASSSTVGHSGESLTRDKNGRFHAFNILDLDSDWYLCVEKMADKFDFMLGRGASFCRYARGFHASGEKRYTAREDLINPQPKVPLAGRVTVSDLVTWVSGPLAQLGQIYTLIGQNYDEFSNDLQQFLSGQCSFQQSLDAVCANKFMLLSAIGRDYTIFFRASEELRQDKEVVAAAVHAAAIQCDDDQLKTVLLQTIGVSEAARFLGLKELPNVAKQGDNVALFVLHLSLIDGSASVRRTAVDALTRLANRGDRQVIASVAQFSKDNDWRVRWRAVEGLAQVARRGDQQAIATVMQRLHDSDKQVRIAAVEALAQLAAPGDQHAIDAVAMCLNDSDKDIHSTAVIALAKLKERGDPPANVAGENVEQSSAVTLDKAQAGQKKAKLSVAPQLENSDGKGRRAAMEGFAQLRLRQDKGSGAENNQTTGPRQESGNKSKKDEMDRPEVHNAYLHASQTVKRQELENKCKLDEERQEIENTPKLDEGAGPVVNYASLQSSQKGETKKKKKKKLSNQL